MSGGWQVGDLALCVRSGPTIKDGEIHAVIRVFDDTGGLQLEGKHSSTFRGSYCASRFRKIKPDTEPCEAEFTAPLKRSSPAKVDGVPDFTNSRAALLAAGIYP